MDDRRRIAGTAAACVALAALTLLLPRAIGYDPWNWLTWGRQLTDLTLDTRGGTVWKPLPVLVTAPLALTGAAAPTLWLLVVRSAAFAALLGTYRLGARLGGRAAGVLAAGALPLLPDALVWFYEGTSEWILAAAVVWAVHAHLTGRERRALGLWVLAALVRPEAWPFLLVAGVRAARRDRALRARAAVAAVGVPVLWAAPQWWGSGSPLAAGRVASTSAGALLTRRLGPPWLVTLERFAHAVPAGILLAAGFAVAEAARARRWTTPVLAAGAVAWVSVVALMAEAGFAGMLRFMLPAAIVGWALGAAGLTRIAALGPRVAGPALAGMLALAGPAAYAGDGVRRVHGEAIAVARAAQHQAELAVALRRAGGPARVLACGRPQIYEYAAPLVAWALDEPARARWPRGAGIVVVRSRPLPHDPFLPPAPLGNPRLARLASAPGWQVLGDCRGTLARAGGGAGPHAG